MNGNIINSKGVHAGVVKGAAIFDLSGHKLYDLKGVNIYRLSGELVGHLNEASGSESAFNVILIGYSPLSISDPDECTLRRPTYQPPPTAAARR